MDLGHFSLMFGISVSSEEAPLSAHTFSRFMPTYSAAGGHIRAAMMRACRPQPAVSQATRTDWFAMSKQNSQSDAGCSA